MKDIAVITPPPPQSDLTCCIRAFFALSGLVLATTLTLALLFPTLAVAQTTPGKVTGVVAIIESGGNRIYWNTPSGAIAGYQIQRSLDGVNYNTVIFLSVLAGTLATTTFDSISAPETYSYRVRARNAEGNGEYSDLVATLVAAPPGKVTGVTVLTESGGNRINWNIPTNIIAGYQIQRTTDRVNYSTVIFLSVIADTLRTTTFDSIAAPETYSYRVRASNTEGQGAYSDTVAAMGPPPTLTNFQADPTGLEVALSWNVADGGSDITGYTLTRKLGSDTAVPLTAPSTTATTLTDTVPAAGDYTYSLIATNAEGDSTAVTATATAIALPGKVIGVVAIIESGGNRIYWNTPDGTVTQYQIQRSTNGVNYNTVIFLSVLAGTLATTTFDSISAPETYSYRVRASNAEGNGAYSDLVATLVAAPPGKVTGVTVSTESDGNRINWNIPTNIIAGYQIQRTTNGVNYGTVIFLSVIADTLRTTTFDRISAPETYSYRVRASNTEGQGAYSDTVSADTVPALSNFAATATNLEVALSWDVNNGGSDISGYTLTRMFGSEAAETITVADPGVTTMLTDTVPAAGVYEYTLIATNAEGNSNTETVMATATAPVADPVAPDHTVEALIGNANTLTIPFSEIVPAVSGNTFEELTVTFSLDTATSLFFQSFESFVGAAPTTALTSGADIRTVDADTVVITTSFGSSHNSNLFFDYTVTNTAGVSDSGVITIDFVNVIGDVMANPHTVTLSDLSGLPTVEIEITLDDVATTLLAGTQIRSAALNGITFSGISAGSDAGTLEITDPTPGAGTGITLRYTPVPGFSGTETFDYTVSYQGNSDTSTISFVVPAAIAPVLSNFAADSTGFEVALTWDVNNGGSDITGYTLTRMLAGAATETITVTDPSVTTMLTDTVTAAGDYTYTLIATNAEGTDTATVTIQVTAALADPTITADVPTQTATAGTAITPVIITSTGGAVASYSIAPAIANGLAFDTSTGTISGTPTAVAGAVEYTITGTNAGGTAVATATVTITVTAVLIAPDISASVPTLSATADTAITPVTIDSTGGEVASYSIDPDIAMTPGLEFDATTGTISGTPTAAAVEVTYTITATNDADSDTATVTITVTAAPTLSDFAATATVLEVVLTWEVSDGGNDITGYTLTRTLGSAAETITPPPAIDVTTITDTVPAVGDYTYSLIATNDIGPSTAATVTVTATNAAPTADAGDAQTVAEGALVTLDGSSSSDPESETLTYAWTQTSGADVTLSSTTAAAPTFTAPNNLTANATLVFSLIVTDARGLVSTPDTVTITVSLPAPDDGSASDGSNQGALVLMPDFGAEGLILLPGETQEITISGGVPPYTAVRSRGDSIITVGEIVDGTMLSIIGANVGMATLIIQDLGGNPVELKVEVYAPPLLGSDDGAVFRGGVRDSVTEERETRRDFADDGSFSVGDVVEIVFVITPRASDIDEQASILIVGRMESAPNALMFLPKDWQSESKGGVLRDLAMQVADLDVDTVDAVRLAEITYKQATLAANNLLKITSEPVILTEGLVGNWEVFIGYRLANGDVFYNMEPMKIEVTR